MKRSISKTLALILAVCLAIPLVACGGKRKGADTLVIGYDYFSSKFSPFFAKTEYDMNVFGQTLAYLRETCSDEEIETCFHVLKEYTKARRRKHYQAK